MPVNDNGGEAGGKAMKKTQSRLAVIQTHEPDEPNDREEDGREGLTAVLVDMGTLNWRVGRTLLGGRQMLPRDFEVTLVPGPEGLQ